MSAIGDLILRVIAEMKGFEASVVKDAEKAGDKAGLTLGKSMAANLKKSWSGQDIGKGLIQGLGLAGGLGAANLVQRAISGVVDVLQDSVAAAREDQASKAALAGALREQIPLWDGNTDAIERVIESRQRLGFTDEEQRLSLQRLLPVYKDVNKALDIQRAAMDLARFKRISLADATTQLVTIEAGQYRSLKQLIGSTKDITNSTEALAAVRRAAGDAAEDMAATDEGKVLAAQIRQAEAIEKLGYILMPAYTEAIVAASGVTEDLAGNLDGVTKAAAAFGGVMDMLGVKQDKAAAGGFDLVHAAQDLLAVANPTKISGTMGVLLDTVDKLGLSTADARDVLRSFGFEVADASDHSADAIEGLKGSAAPDLAAVGTALEGTGVEADDMADEIRAAALGSSKAFDDMKRSMVDDARELIDDAYDPIITQDRLRATEAEIAAQREILASSKSTAAQKRDAREKLHQLTKDNAQYLLELAEAGQTNNKAYAKGMKELKAEIAKAKGPAKQALQEVLDKILEVERAGKVVPVNVVVASQTTDWARRLAGNLRASGGPVQAGVPYVVGERRAEIYVPEQDGYVYSSVRGGLDAVGAAGGGDTNITVALPTTARPDPFEVATQLRRLADMRVLTPGGRP